jgi:hypothetical protein
MNALDAALYAKLTGDTTLMGYLTGGVHSVVAVDPDFPYLVFQKVGGGEPTYTFKYQVNTPFLYQFRVIGQGPSKVAISNALERVRALLNLQPLTISGATHWLTRWIGDMPDMAERDEDGSVLIQVGATYRIELGG